MRDASEARCGMGHREGSVSIYNEQLLLHPALSFMRKTDFAISDFL